MKNIFLISLVFVLVTVSFQCIPKFEEPVAPSWDTQLGITILNKEYTLKDLISKDTSVITIDSLTNEIFYKTSSASNPSTVGDALVIHPVPTRPESIQVGLFRVQTPTLPSQTVPILDSIPFPFGYDSVMNFPDTSVRVPLGNQFTEFEFVKFASGVLSLSLTNNLPVPITPDTIIIYNTTDGGIVARYFNFGTIQPSGISQQNFPLAQSDTMRDQLSLYAHIVTESGSVHLPMGAKSITFGANITNNPTASAARGIIPSQRTSVARATPFTTDTSAQPTKINFASFKSGRLAFVVNNHSDVEIRLNLKLNDFKRVAAPHSSLLDSIFVNRFGKDSISIDMTEYNIDYAGQPSSQFNFEAEITTLQSGASFSTIKSTDFVEAYITIPDENFILQSVNGRVTPFESIVAETLRVSLTDVDPHFSGNLSFSGFKVGLGLYVGGGVKTALDMKIYGIDTVTGIIDSILIPAGEDTIFPSPQGQPPKLNIINLNVDQFLSSFSFPNLPNMFVFAGKARFNPDYQQGFIADTTSLYGTTDFTIPMKMRIFNGLFLDTSDVETNIDQDQLENINFGTISINVNNGMPLRSSLQLDILDSLFLDGDSIHGSRFRTTLLVDSARVSQGLSTLATNEITIQNADAKAIAKGDFSLIKLGLQTSGNEIVTFRTTDKIIIRITAKLGYRVKSDENSVQPPIKTSAK
ncbi:MAG: hypothetical protein KGZ58_13450 [Ignavibacteriales bacterium]|nr:hypothetical protein [Ignavibacteriales bacterium]